MSPKDELEKWFETSAEKVQRNAQIVTPEDLRNEDYDGTYLLHISSDTNIKKFVPVIGRRQSKMEDRTVPRVCVCPSLLGCMIGYGKAENDFMELPSDGSKDNDSYKGGWKIYAFETPVSLRPNKTLVYDQAYSDELWLTMYSPQTIDYVPVAAGKLFWRTIGMVSRSGKLPVGEVEMFIEVTYEKGIMFSENLFLSPGYYQIDGPLPSNTKSWKSREFTAKQISRTDYFAHKKVSADMLSLPAYLRW